MSDLMLLVGLVVVVCLLWAGVWKYAERRTERAIIRARLDALQAETQAQYNVEPADPSALLDIKRFLDDLYASERDEA